MSSAVHRKCSNKQCLPTSIRHRFDSARSGQPPRTAEVKLSILKQSVGRLQDSRSLGVLIPPLSIAILNMSAYVQKVYQVACIGCLCLAPHALDMQD
eukprot:3936545-Pyramimonas_sp.AAC.1